MGCDIHIVLERRKKPGGKWIGVYATDTLPGGRGRFKISQRDYDFFAEIANVRGRSASSNYPRNIPEDVSELAWQQYMRSPTDHHSPSHMTPKEFTDAWLRVNLPDRGRGDVREDYAITDLLGIYSDEEDYDFRVVFWFDN